MIDTLIYANEAGNHYKVNELKYFISEVTLYSSSGKKTLLTSQNGIHYIDNSITATMSWNISDNIPEGQYDSLTFVFGINEAKNKTGLFVNPPEVDMAWPGMLGGGYHYMMLNGKWKDADNKLQNLNFHLGIGQLFKSDVMVPDSIYAFVQNYFTVILKSSAFAIKNNSTTYFFLAMNIDKWFKGAYTFDFNADGMNIMMNQTAMTKMKANGKNVFSRKIPLIK